MTTISVVGCSHIHVPGFARMIAARPDLRVAAVWDAEPARRDAWAKAMNARAAESADDAIAAGAGGVVITGRTDEHAALVAAATTAKRPLFVEKPLGLAAADAYAMADAVEAAGVIFQTGYFQRSDPINRRVKQMVDAGDFGRITRVRGSNAHSGALGDWFRRKPDAPHEDWHWMTEPAKSGVGAFGDLGTHSLDILLWWMGDATRVTAQVDPVTNAYGCDESGEAMLRFAGGAIGTLAAGWVDAADPVTYLVSGTSGHAAVIGGKLFVTAGPSPKFDPASPVTDLPARAPHAFEGFLDAVSGREPAVPLVTVREAAYRSAVMAAMYEGAQRGTWVESVRPRRPAD